ncbi:MAG: DUF4838 domain-containing protein [Armatimonadota bacterium]
MRAALVALTLAVAAGAHADVTLVQDGTPVAAIVLPADAGETLALAAQELQEHVRLISGAELSVMDEAQAPDGPAVHLGLTERALRLNLPLTAADVGWDGYVIRTEGDTLLLAGRNDAGTLNAVYGFLQDVLGVRWYDPGPVGTYLPELQTITVPEITIVDRPRFIVRSPWYNGNVLRGWSEEELEAYRVWGRRNRIGGVSGYVGHHWFTAIPPQRYFADHPEYFSLIQGERRPVQLCTSNPNVVDLYVADITARFEANPDLRYASISPNDGAGWCECEACRAVSEDLTTRIVTFINEVARRVGEQFPDRYIAFYAYADLVQPPAEDITLERNVMPWIAHYSVCQLHPIGDPRCPHQAGFRRIFEGWRAIAEQVGVREYASWWPVPACETRRIAMDTRWYASMGGLGMSREYLEMQFGTHLLRWLEAQMLWNPDRSREELLDDWFAHFYGPAAERMRTVYQRLSHQQEIACPYGDQWTGNLHEACQIFPLQMLEEAVAEVAEIAAEAPEGAIRERLTRDRIALAHAAAFARAWEADRTYVRSAAPVARQPALDALQRVVGLRDAMPDNLIVSVLVREWAQRQIAQYSADRTLIAQAGEWRLRDSLNEGGMARLDAEVFEGLQTGRWGLSLPPGREGVLQYHFRTEGDLRFTAARLEAMFIKAGDGVTNRVEVQRQGGEWQTLAQDLQLASWDYTVPFTEMIAGASEFRVRLWFRNDAGESVLVLDNIGIAGEAR